MQSPDDSLVAEPVVWKLELRRAGAAARCRRAVPSGRCRPGPQAVFQRPMYCRLRCPVADGVSVAE